MSLLDPHSSGKVTVVSVPYDVNEYLHCEHLLHDEPMIDAITTVANKTFLILIRLCFGQK